MRANICLRVQVREHVFLQPARCAIHRVLEEKCENARETADSLFGTSANAVRGCEQDPLLRFYDQCPRYERDVKENENASIQVRLYKESKQMQKNIDTLKSKLNLPRDAVISVTDVEAAFSACG